MWKQCCTWTEYVTPAMTYSSNLVKYWLSISVFLYFNICRYLAVYVACSSDCEATQQSVIPGQQRISQHYWATSSAHGIQCHRRQNKHSRRHLPPWNHSSSVPCKLLAGIWPLLATNTISKCKNTTVPFAVKIPYKRINIRNCWLFNEQI